MNYLTRLQLRSILRTPKRIFLFLIVFLLWVTGCSVPTNIPPTQTLVPTIFIPSQTATKEATVTPSPSPSPTETPLPTATATPEPSPTPTPAVLIGAGDIASCGEENLADENTAAIIARQIEQYPNVVVFTAGDVVYSEGRAVEYRNCFGPSWGQFTDRLRPAPGNHDYMTDLGGPYYEYFGEAAGPAGFGYYSYDLGDWHIVALNSNCNEIACGPDSRQAQWLREDLAASQASCTMLYWHHPRFSSGIAGGSGSVNTFWEIASEYGAEIVVNGHDHDYERFAPMDANGNAHPDGIRLFVVGTGGAYLRDWGEIKPNSEIRHNESHGVIQFHLYPGRYQWQFLPTEGTFSDTGSGECH